MPNPFNHENTQVGDLSIPQCTNFIEDLIPEELKSHTCFHLFNEFIFISN